MIKFNKILKESLSIADFDAYYHGYSPKQSHFPFYDTSYLRAHMPEEFSKLINQYISAIGSNERYPLYAFYKNHLELFEFLQEEIKKEYGARIELYRGINISAYNKEWHARKVGDVVTLEATTNHLMGWTNDNSIAEGFAKMGEGLPAGASRQDWESGATQDYVDPKHATDMLGYIFKASVPYDKIIYAPNLFDREIKRELFAKAEKSASATATAWGLQQEQEFISLSGITTKIIEGYVFDMEHTMDWESVECPYTEWIEMHQDEDDD